MNLQLYLRVFWRFRLLVVGGLLLAVALAVFSYVHVDFSGGKPSFTYRESEQWESLATVGVGSRSFDPGSVLTPETRGFLREPAESLEEAERQRSQIDPATLASLPRLNEITVQLMQLATSDQVMQRIRRDGGGPIRGALQTFPVTSGDSLVPYITFSAIAISPEEAVSLAGRHLRAFNEYVTEQQDAATIKPEERVVLTVTKQPRGAALLEGRKKTRPIIVFLAVMTAVLGLAFVLENLRPRVRPVAPRDADEDSEEPKHRRSA